MGDFRPASLFVSYSHLDQDVVRPLTELNEDLKAAAWVDYLHTVPGGDWEEAHKKAIKKCYRLILLWSVNASASPQVAREWRCALECGTAIVPVLLDATPLPAELAGIHGVSLQEFVHAKRDRLNPRWLLPIEWMGLGTWRGDLWDVALTLIIMAVPLALGIWGWSLDATLPNALAILPLAIFLLIAFVSLAGMRAAVKRAKLRHRLSRIVIQSLKEWGNENRGPAATDPPPV